MNDAVDRLIVERGEMDRGMPGGVILSVGAHALLLGGAILAVLLGPKESLLRMETGFAVALPPGGAGSPTASAPAPAQQVPEPKKPDITQPPQPEPPKPKVVKPPKAEKKTGLPDPDAKKSKKTVEKPRPEPASAVGGTGTSNEFPGLSFGTSGPGAPGGTDMNGDWYLGGVQQKIWMLWQQQVRIGTWQPFTVAFTIQADGSVTDVKVETSSGVFNLDLAAQRAISSAAPFGPLPKTYGKDHYPIHATFNPVP